MVGIIIRPSKKERVSYNQMREGRVHTVEQGMSGQQAERAIRDHLEGANPTEMRKEYANHFNRKDK